MEQPTNTTNRKIAAAFHFGAMLLALFAPPLNVIIPLVAFPFIGKKGSLLNNQAREVSRFQIMGIVVVLLAFLIDLGLAAAFETTGALIGYYVVKVVAAGYYIMPVFASIQILRGRNYAYPLVGSPRRKAYVDETRPKGRRFS